jgi:hypothetical protein
VTHAFDTPGAVTIRATLTAPDVEVESWDRPRTEIDLVPLRDDATTAEAIEAVRVDHRVLGDGRHEVAVAQRKRGIVVGFSRDPQFVVRLRIPEGAHVEVGAASSDVRCRGVLGGLEVKTASGDVAADVVQGRVVVDSASGDVSVGACVGLAAKLVSGDLVVREARGPLEVTSVSGDIEIRSFDGEVVRIRSVSGDVALDVVPGRRVHFDVSSVSGDTSTSLSAADGAGAAGEVMEIHVRTVSGDVRIGRAGVPA